MTSTDVLRNDHDVRRTVPNQYSELLQPSCNGHALWAPRKTTGGGGALGDVGYIRDGSFWKEGNVYVDPPYNIQPLDAPTAGIYRDEHFHMPIMQSSTSSTVSFHISGSTTPAALPLTSLSVEPQIILKQKRLAFLAPPIPTVQDTVSLANETALCDWLTDNRHRLDPNLVVLTHTVRSSGWIGGVVTGRDANASVSVSGALGAVANLGVNASVELEVARLALTQGPRPAEWSEHQAEYTLVVRFIRMRTRVQRQLLKMKLALSLGNGRHAQAELARPTLTQKSLPPDGELEGALKRLNRAIPRPAPRLNSAVNAHIAASTAQRPPSPLKQQYSLSTLDVENMPAEGISPTTPTKLGNIGGMKSPGSRSREGSPALEELQAKLGIKSTPPRPSPSSRESSPAVEERRERTSARFASPLGMHRSRSTPSLDTTSTKASPLPASKSTTPTRSPFSWSRKSPVPEVRTSPSPGPFGSLANTLKGRNRSGTLPQEEDEFGASIGRPDADTTLKGRKRSGTGALSSPREDDARCATCGDALFSSAGGGRVVRIDGNAFHASCFTCDVCRRPFQEDTRGQALFVRGVGGRGHVHVDCAPPLPTTTTTTFAQHKTRSRSVDVSKTHGSFAFKSPSMVDVSTLGSGLKSPPLGSRTCPGCNIGVAPMERGVVQGPSGSKWHASCLVCGGKGARKAEGKAGCGKKLDSGARCDEVGTAWCRECWMLLPRFKERNRSGTLPHEEDEFGASTGRPDADTTFKGRKPAGTGALPSPREDDALFSIAGGASTGSAPADRHSVAAEDSEDSNRQTFEQDDVEYPNEDNECDQTILDHILDMVLDDHEDLDFAMADLRIVSDFLRKYPNVHYASRVWNSPATYIRPIFVTKMVPSPDGNTVESVAFITDLYPTADLELATEVTEANARDVGLRSAVQESEKVFEIEPLSSDTFLVPNVTDSQQPSRSEDNRYTGRVACSIPFSTADGRQLVAFGCADGVWIGLRRDSSSLKRVLHLKHVTQCAVLEDIGIFLVLADKSLFAYRIEELVPSQPTSHMHTSQTPQKLNGNNDVQFFSVGTLNGRTLVIYMNKKGLHSLFHVLEPLTDNIAEKPRTSKLFGFGQHRAEWFRIYLQDFLLPFEAHDLIFLKSRIAILSQTGFHIMDLGETKSVTIPQRDDPRLAPLAKRLESCRPLGMFRTSENEYLLCYNEFGLYVDRHGDPHRQSGTIEWEGNTDKVAWHPPYVLLFDSRFIEIRHIDTGRLVQIIPGNEVRCTWDGRGGGGPPAMTAGPGGRQDGTSQESRVHAAMCAEPMPGMPHAKGSYQDVFELVPTYMPGSSPVPDT